MDVNGQPGMRGIEKRVSVYRAVLRSRQGESAVKENERAALLRTRLDENLLSRALGIGENCSIENLHEFGRFIAMHQYLTEEYSFDRDEAERLLKFRDPLEVAVECTGLSDTIHDLNVAYYLDMANPEADYPMLPDSGTPAPEPAQKPERRRPAHKNKER